MKTTKMSFTEAVVAAMEGQKVRRSWWAKDLWLFYAGLAKLKRNRDYDKATVPEMQWLDCQDYLATD
jgi:hypothetical protein